MIYSKEPSATRRAQLEWGRQFNANSVLERWNPCRRCRHIAQEKIEVVLFAFGVKTSRHISPLAAITAFPWSQGSVLRRPLPYSSPAKQRHQTPTLSVSSQRNCGGRWSRISRLAFCPPSSETWSDISSLCSSCGHPKSHLYPFVS